MYLLADFGPRLHIGNRIDRMFEAVTQFGGVYDRQKAVGAKAIALSRRKQGFESPRERQ